jgi:hypothetical protein
MGLHAQLDAECSRRLTIPRMAICASLLAAVDDQHPVQVRIIPHSPTSAEILLAGYDLLGAFSMMTGLMTVHGILSTTLACGNPH